MKRILIFIGMKVVEIGALVFVPWGVGKLAWVLGSPIGNRGLDWSGSSGMWLYGLMHLCVLLLVLMVCAIVGLILRANWLKATERAGKEDKKL